MRRVVYLGNVWEYPAAIAQIAGVCLAALLYEEPADAERALELSRQTGAQTYRVKDDEEVGQALVAIGSADLGVIANFGVILSADTLTQCKKGFINCHPGLLPTQKGREPVSRLWKAGGGPSGLTIHAVEARVDVGKVLAVAPHLIDSKKTLNTALQNLYLAGLPLLNPTILSCLSASI